VAPCRASPRNSNMHSNVIASGGSICKRSVGRQPQLTPKTVRLIQKRLARMLRVDQRIRRDIEYYQARAAAGGDSTDRRRLRHLRSAKEISDPQHDAALADIVASFGWPRVSIFGAAAANAAFVLALHVESLPRQRAWLRLLEKADRAGDADRFHYCYLWDRVALRMKSKQRFGTHFVSLKSNDWTLLPVESIRRANKLRHERGLRSVEEEIRQYKLFYGRLKRAHEQSSRDLRRSVSGDA